MSVKRGKKPPKRGAMSGGRSVFLGTYVTPAEKERLKVEAKFRGVSLTAHVADVLAGGDLRLREGKKA